VNSLSISTEDFAYCDVIGIDAVVVPDRPANCIIIIIIILLLLLLLWH
jgi:hypothetical protein